MYLLYSLVLYLTVPLVLSRLVWSGFGNREYWRRWPERFGHVGEPGFSGPVIWIHAVSVGEVQAARPLLDYLQKHQPESSLLITTMTPTGARTVERLYGDNVVHRYLPYDLPHVTRRFLDAVGPSLLIVMETEIWPNLFRQCHRRGIPIALVNARMSEKSSRGYRRLGSLTAGTLNCLTLIAAQSGADAERFHGLGAPSQIVKVTGNLKFDINQPHSIIEAGEVMRRFFSVNRPVWIAASTHEGEERMVLEAFKQVLGNHADCLLVLAPRHTERAGDLMELCRRFGFKSIVHSDNRDYSEYTQVYIIDSLGELPVFYAASDISFVGGSLIPRGGHNMLEPASLGVPVITGDYLFNFREVAELLSHAEALVQVSTVTELASKVCQLLEDANLSHTLGERGRQVVRNNQGTLIRLIDYLTELLPIQHPQ